MLNYENYFNGSNQDCRLVELGKLYLSSGEIYCCDPFLSDEVGPFRITVSPGQYQVQLCIADSSEWGPRVALSRLVISNEPSVSWSEALYLTNDQEAGGFRVDAGLACFLDAETQQLFTKVVDAFHERNPLANYYDDILAPEFKRNVEPDSPRKDGDWLLHYPAVNDPRNVAMFATGLGDGYYSAYWGFDQSQRPTMLVADFRLLG